ncbi:MAG: response regulator [Desulfobacteraceae bacterium]|nr:response regulator [Desulfobacteraceae bacterium]
MALKQKHTLLIVDDEQSIIRSLQRLFTKLGHEVLTATNGAEALEVLSKCTQGVSIIISDHRMPAMNGVDFLKHAKQICPDAVRILLTGFSDTEIIVQAVNQGEIHGYFTKPWEDQELASHVHNALERHELQSEVRRLTEMTIQQNRQLNSQNKELEHQVQIRTQALVEKSKTLEEANRMLEQGFMDSIHLLSSLVEILNASLGNRMRQVAALARGTAEAFGLGSEELNQIEMAGMIHDIGLLILPEEIRTMDVSRMNDKQFRMFSHHPVMGSILLERVPKLAAVGEIILYHHEQVDGQGFPNGLSGSQIPLGSKIIMAASDYYQTFDTWPKDIRKLIAKTKQHFDSSVFESFTLDDDPDTIISEIGQQFLRNGADKKYDAQVVSALIMQICKKSNIEPKMAVSLNNIQPGMTLMADLRLKDGRLLLTRGTVFKEASIKSIQTLVERGLLDGEVTVSLPPEKEAASNA